MGSLDSTLLHLEIEIEATRRVDIVCGDNARERDLYLMEAIRLVNKKVDGAITEEERKKLDYLNKVAEYITEVRVVEFAEKAWVSDPKRTWEELASYNVLIPKTKAWPDDGWRYPDKVEPISFDGRYRHN